MAGRFSGLFERFGFGNKSMDKKEDSPRGSSAAMRRKEKPHCEGNKVANEKNEVPPSSQNRLADPAGLGEGSMSTSREPISGDVVLAELRSLREFLDARLKDISFEVHQVLECLTGSRRSGPKAATEGSPKVLIRAQSPMTPGDREILDAPELVSALVAAQTISDMSAAYCRGELDTEGMIRAAKERGLQWGSGFTPGNRPVLQPKFDNADYKILFFQSQPGDDRYLLLLRDGAMWEIDFSLVFDGRAAGGSVGDEQPNGRCTTKEAATGTYRIQDNEIVVAERGRVDVG